MEPQRDLPQFHDRLSRDDTHDFVELGLEQGQSLVLGRLVEAGTEPQRPSAQRLHLLTGMTEQDGGKAENNKKSLHENRSGDSRSSATGGFSPQISEATILPVAGARLSPIMAWPVATVRFFQRCVLPM